SLVVQGWTAADGKDMPGALMNAVGPNFFRTLRSPLVAGREFNEGDASASPRVAIIDEAFARRYFQDRVPLGQWLAISYQPDLRYEVVGVVRGYKYTSLRSDLSPTVFLPAAQVPADSPEAD